VTTLAALSKDIDLTAAERDFVLKVVEQLRKADTFGASARKPLTMRAIIDGVRAAAFDAETQYRRTLYVELAERMEALDAAHSLLLGIMIEFNKIKPILVKHSEAKKNGGNP
jgi:hypothetical protein